MHVPIEDKYDDTKNMVYQETERALDQSHVRMEMV
jgi:hypothetical protein